MTFSTFRFFFLTAAFLVCGLFYAHADERAFRELPMFAFCSSPEIVDEINAAFAAGDVMEAKAISNNAEKTGTCVNTYPRPVMFRGQEIVRRYTAEQSGTVPEIVVKGTLTRTGQTVYVWADAKLEEEFYAESEGT